MRRTGISLSLVLSLSFIAACQENPLLEEGYCYAEVSGGKIWYYIIGSGDKDPLVLLHGGPGGNSESMFALSELGGERPLVIFDQLGTGKSDHITDTSLMNINYQVDQLKEFIDFLGIKDFYLYGHSWGTMLALDYYLEYPQGVEAMILNSPALSAERWLRDADTLISTLPENLQDAIRDQEILGDYDSFEYQAAEIYYYHMYIRRGPRVETPYDTIVHPRNTLMYEYMWGPSEFTATGTLQDYERTCRLGEINVPVLYLTGEFDEARPNTVKYYSSLTPKSEFRVIEGAAHATMHDNQQQNVSYIRDFLKRMDQE